MNRLDNAMLYGIALRLDNKEVPAKAALDAAYALGETRAVLDRVAESAAAAAQTLKGKSHE